MSVLGRADGARFAAAGAVGASEQPTMTSAAPANNSSFFTPTSADLSAQSTTCSFDESCV